MALPWAGKGQGVWESLTSGLSGAEVLMVPSAVPKKYLIRYQAIQAGIDEILSEVIFISTGTKRYKAVVGAFLLSHGRSHKFKSCIAQPTPYVVGEIGSHPKTDASCSSNLSP